MPIYEYQCQSCGHIEEALQKISDEPLKNCPKCSKSSLEKIISSTQFQLKGEGWYVTDFKNPKKSNNENAGADTKSTEKKFTE